MAVTKAQWEAIETQIVTDMADGIHIGSYSLGGRSFAYRTLEDQRKFLQFVQTQIIAADGSGTNTFFQLATMADI